MDNQPAFDVNKKNNMGYTPLHTACKAHKGDTVQMYETVRVLIENGADCAEKVSSGVIASPGSRLTAEGLAGIP